MKKLGSVALAIFALPLLADTPPRIDMRPYPLAAKGIPTYAEFKEQQAWRTEFEAKALARYDSDHPDQFATAQRCFFIGQVNRNLTKPNAKGEFLPLAGAEAIANSSVDCLPTTVIKAVQR